MTESTEQPEDEALSFGELMKRGLQKTSLTYPWITIYNDYKDFSGTRIKTPNKAPYHVMFHTNPTSTFKDQIWCQYVFNIEEHTLSYRLELAYSPMCSTLKAYRPDGDGPAVYNVSNKYIIRTDENYLKWLKCHGIHKDWILFKIGNERSFQCKRN